MYEKPLGVKSALFDSFYNFAHICTDKFRNVAAFFTQIGGQSQICFFHRQDCFEVFYQRYSRQKTALSSVAYKTHIFDKFCQHSLRRTKLFSLALTESYFVFQKSLSVRHISARYYAVKQSLFVLEFMLVKPSRKTVDIFLFKQFHGVPQNYAYQRSVTFFALRTTLIYVQYMRGLNFSVFKRLDFAKRICHAVKVGSISHKHVFVFAYRARPCEKLRDNSSPHTYEKPNILVAFDYVHNIFLVRYSCIGIFDKTYIVIKRRYVAYYALCIVEVVGHATYAYASARHNFACLFCQIFAYFSADFYI